MRSKRSVLFHLVIMVFLVTFAVRCSPGPVGGPEAPAPSSGEELAGETPKTTTPEEGGEEEPVTEGLQSVIRLPAAQIDNLDPSGIPSTNDTDIQQKMFTGLLDYKSDGTEVFVGAESYEVNDTADVYTFHLREEAKWSDGEPITAHDYVWAWRHVQDPERASGYASYAYIVKNAEAINTGEIDDLAQLGVEALDDYTLQVTLESPATFFPRLVAFPTMYPLRQDVIEEYGDDWLEPENIVSNGPWNMAEWEKDVRVVLERNPNWWGEPVLGERIEYFLMDDVEATSPAMFEAGELDIARFPPEEYARLSNDPELSDEIRIVTQSLVNFVVFDAGSPPFDDVRVRQAFSLAIDRENLVNGVLQGMGDPAYILVPPGIAGRNPDAALSSGDYEQDVQRAKELMAEAGYPNGEGFPEVELKYISSSANQKLGEALPAMWEEHLGVTVNAAPTESQAFRQWFRSRDTQPFDMQLYGWGSDFEDPYNYFNTIWPSWSDLYHTHWVNEEYDAAARAAGVETDPETRVEMYEGVHEILEREVPFAPTYFGVRSYLVKPWVHGDIFNRRSGYTLQWAWVSPH